MRIISAIIILAALPIAHASTNTVTVTALQDSKRTDFVPEACDQIATLSLELLRTASYEADQSIATEKRFREAQETSHVHLTFTPSRTVTFQFSTTGPSVDKRIEITEMVIPISASKMGNYLLIRDGEKVRAFAKWAPKPAFALQEALKKILK